MNAAASTSSSMKYPATFFINSSILPAHVNRTVRLIGKVVQVSADGSRVQIESADGGIVNVTRSIGSEHFTSKFVCVTGVVQQDFSVRESVSESFGDSFNLDNFNKVIGYMQRSPALFAVNTAARH